MNPSRFEPGAHQSPPDTYYAATANRALDYPPLQGEVKVDVCVIGGGFTGINTAIELAQRGFSVALVEARRIGWGASGRNGGQLIRGIGHDVERFARWVGEDGVRAFKRMGIAAMQIVRERIELHDIACDLTWGFCDVANRPSDLERFAREQADLEELGYPHEVRLLPREQLHEVIGSNRYWGGLVDMGSGHLHPLNLALGEAVLAKRLGVHLYEHSPVTDIRYGNELRVRTVRGEVHARNLVLACNAYIGRLEPWLSSKVMPAGSYLIATEPLPRALAQQVLPQNMAVCDQRIALDYFRLTADRRLLFGGACHYSGRDPQDIGAYMRPKMLAVFPQLDGMRIDYQWGGMIGIGANRLPQIGRLPRRANVYYAQAYSGHGLNTTHLAANLLAEAIAGQEGGGFDLFAKVPHASFPGGARLRSPLLALGMLYHRLLERR